MKATEKDKKILDLIPKLRNLDDQKLDMISNCVDASLTVQYLMTLLEGKKDTARA